LTDKSSKKVIWILLFSWVVFVYLAFLYFWREGILWESIGETFFRIFLLFIFLLINIGLGKKILRWLKFEIESFLESLLFSTGIGLAILTFLLIGLGLAGLFNRWAGSLLLLGIFLFTYKDIENVIRKIKVKSRSIIPSKISLESALLFILFIQIVINLFGAAVLPSSWDALSVHLAQAKEWVSLGRLTIIPYFRFGNEVPHNIGILYAMALLMKDAILAKLIHFSLGILTTVGVYVLARKYFSHKSGLLASVIFYTVPIVSLQSTTAYVDLGLTFYVFLAVYAFVNWISVKKRGWLFISAVMTGLCLGSKYTGFLWLGILALGIIINGLVFRREKWLVSIKNLFLYTILAGSIGSFWYLRLGGLSVFGFLYDMLRGAMWQKAFGMIDIGAAINSVSNVLAPYFLLPWNMTMHSGSFPGIGGFGFVFLAFLPLLILPRFRRHGVIKVVLFFSLLYLAFWAWCFPYKRGLVSVLPLLSIAVSYVVVKMMHLNAFFEKIFSILVVLAFVFQIFYLAPEGLSKVYQRMLVFTGLESQEAYILRNEGTYPVFKYINENSSPEAKVWVLNDPRTFYCDRSYVTFLKLGPVDSAEEILANLKKESITHLVFNQYLWELHYRGRGKYPTMINVLKPEYLDAVYEKYPFIVWRISYPKGGYGG